MKKIVGYIALSFFTLYANNIELASSNMIIKGNGEECSVSIDRLGAISKTNCLQITNSKKVKILCTENKKMCKTEDELHEILKKSHNDNILNKTENYKADKYYEMYTNCLNDMGITNNTSVIGCSENVSEVVKKEMNRLYIVIYNKILKQSADDARKFEKSQKSWLNYRDTHCKLMGSYVGSPMYGYCPMNLNIDRVIELKELSE